MALGADMAGGAAFGAVVGVGADEQPAAAVVDDDLVEIDVVAPHSPQACGAWMVRNG